MNPDNVILVYSTLGSGSHDEQRIVRLLVNFNIYLVSFDRSKKFSSAIKIIKEAKKHKPCLIIQEGSGVCGFFSLLFCKFVLGISFIVSSGDAIGPFLSAKYPFFYIIFHWYEKLLYKSCKGFIGWTPYLVGRALTLGAKRAVTAEGFPLFPNKNNVSKELSRNKLREKLGISNSAIVFGIIGSVVWNKYYKYAYGMELIRALKKIDNPEIHVVIGGTGNGINYLIKETSSCKAGNVHLIGRVKQEDVIEVLMGFDCCSLPQSCDQVGSFRYSTKISEYILADVPFFSNQIPMAYDLNLNKIFILPGRAPWDNKFIDALADFMGKFDPNTDYKYSNYDTSNLFNEELQVTRITKFVHDILVS
jgi:hypothetical protein